jgi:hypothetical protein
MFKQLLGLFDSASMGQIGAKPEQTAKTKHMYYYPQI